MSNSIQINLSFDQIVSLVKQLPKRQKIELSKELEREAIDSKLSKILTRLRADELDLNTVAEEAAIVRKEIYDKGKR